MNRTPRWLNRTVLLSLGLLLSGAGLAALLLPAVPALRTVWADVAASAAEAVPVIGERTRVEALERSWVWFALLAALALIAVVAVAVIAQQGRGRTESLLRAPAPDGAVPGSVSVGLVVAQQSLRTAVESDPDVLALRVTAHELRGRTALRLSVTARHGSSPARVAERIRALIADWDRTLGAELPLVIEITGGIRTPTSHARRTR